MKAKTGFLKSYIMLLPFIGMGLFVLLYILAAIHYPGGSWNFTDYAGFSIRHNYLCDLLDDNAINGMPNTAKHYARFSLGVLCSSILMIWYFLPYLCVKKSFNLKTMKFSGFLSIGITVFLASGIHDIILRIAGVFGIVAIITACIELYKAKRYKVSGLGLFCLIIFCLNYYIYETELYIESLPRIQKITFLFFILWFIVLNTALYQKVKKA
ncbi:hypothetical protein GCM10023311_03340 [Flaviramulus aquimarinus]|uniref:DUF998 domain-containing protein n=1 Tax=Flaviramulus aquimarinus TaxID=1170456 RepID=A0ABP9EVI8_9FLAO